MPIRALIVTNQSVAQYSTLVGILTDAGIDVDTQSLSGFSFAGTDLSVYDEIWLFSTGTSTLGNETISPADINALATFMDSGGGVFATGDHDALGSQLCGYIPRVRAMRAWFYTNNSDLSPMRDTFPLGYDRNDVTRADTRVATDASVTGSESDNTAQPIDSVLATPHPILTDGSNVLGFLPDHMHEGRTLGRGDGDGSDHLIEADYTHGFDHYVYDGGAAIPAGFVEFPVNGTRETPQVIATRTIGDPNPHGITAKTINALSTYDGFKAGVGRVVTASTFHHYYNLNLNGFADDNPQYDQIKSIIVNIANWLARPEPRIQLVVERSTFSEDEVNSNSVFEDAIFVTVDGLSPNDFVGGPIDTLNPTPAQLAQWAPTITVAGMHAITITPQAPIYTDDPTIPNRMQRFTFRYDVEFTDPAATFNFPEDGPPVNIGIEARLQSTDVDADVSKTAILQLTRSSNPFMLDSMPGVHAALVGDRFENLPGHRQYKLSGQDAHWHDSGCGNCVLAKRVGRHNGNPV